MEGGKGGRADVSTEQVSTGRDHGGLERWAQCDGRGHLLLSCQDSRPADLAQKRSSTKPRGSSCHQPPLSPAAPRSQPMLRLHLSLQAAQPVPASAARCSAPLQNQQAHTYTAPPQAPPPGPASDTPASTHPHTLCTHLVHPVQRLLLQLLRILLPQSLLSSKVLAQLGVLCLQALQGLWQGQGQVSIITATCACQEAQGATTR